jgi:hypothetical protein
MKCTVPVPLPGRKDTSRANTYCYEELDKDGKCPKHGPQFKKHEEEK